MKPILSVSALTLLLASLACGRGEAPQAPTLPIAKVRLAPALEAAPAGWVAATLGSTQRAVLATRLAASVKKVHVMEGQRVAAGALLVSLGDEDLQGSLKAAEAALGAASAQLRRIENLAKQSAATPAELEQASVQVAQARAGVAAVKANIGFTRIRAPFAGVVQARRVSEGDFVAPGMPLVEVEGQGALEFTGSVSEGEAKGLRIGQELSFDLEGRTGLARITGLATGGDPVSHRGSLRAQLIRGAEGLRPGAFGRLKLPGVQAQANPEPSIPRSALVQRGELGGVFVAREGRAELRWLSLGEAQGDRIPVRAGLAKGESVIDAPGDLRDGQPIEVMK